jgi:NAD(P)-dependent dehydrogenase (short-subunit alcohol dehydrogenase family)
MRRADRIDSGRVVAAGTLAWLGWKALQRAREERIAGQVVLITGGSRGLGLLLAREFARKGCDIVICARDPEELRAARTDLEERGASVLAISCDVTDRDQVEAMVARATEHFGGIDILVNNAGIIQVGPIDTMTIRDFERAMDVIFWGSAYATFAVLPAMKARGSGRIVNITSIGGKVAVPHLLPYDCAKFAMVALSEGLRAELARESIRVTTVVPGLMRTGSPVNALFKGKQELEYNWFSLSSATPATTMSAERAARRIVAATRRGEAEVTLTWQANLLRAFHGLAPGVTADLLGLVNRALPKAEGGTRREARGMELDTALSPSPATVLMNRAARETHQFAGRHEPSRTHARKIGLDDGNRPHARE